MKIRSESAAKTQAAGRADQKPAADARARGQKLLSLAAEHALVPPALLGVPKASLDALSGALLEGAVLAAQRRSGDE